MNTVHTEKLSSLRITKETHKKLKQQCAKEGRLIGAYVDSIIKKQFPMTIICQSNQTNANT